jgi:hypothetical protein
MKNKILAFAALLEAHTIQRLKENGFTSQGVLDRAKTHVHDGKKYARVDNADSGRYMVEMATGNIFGIKAYGQVHKGHFYGTVDTMAEYFWGDYYPERLTAPLPAGRSRSAACPGLTFAPKPEDEPAFKVVRNILTGTAVAIPANTPFCCDPSTETYHSM